MKGLLLIAHYKADACCHPYCRQYRQYLPYSAHAYLRTTERWC